MVKVEIKNFIAEDAGGISLPYSAGAEASLSASVTVTQDMAEKRYAYLLLSGLVGEAEVFFGESRLGKISGGERGVYDVKELLSPGNTEIKIKLKEGATLTKPPFLVSFSSAVIDNVQVTERHDGGAVTVDIKLHTLGNFDGVKAIATLVSPAGQIYYGGITKGHGSITVKDPLYWWPRGLGVQNLYKLTVNLYGESDVEDTADLLIGLRTASVLREDGIELSFNSLPFLPMGALYNPPSSCDMTGALSRELLSLARGGANAVFIDASVEYIPSELMEICDREGIVLIRGVGRLSTLAPELDRLSNHPSFAYLVIPEGENEDAAYAAARGSAPDAAIIFGKEFEGAIIETSPSLPDIKTLDAIGDKRVTNPLSTEMLSLGGEAYRDMLARVAEEYLFPAGSVELGYLTRHLQAKEAKEKIANARLGGKSDALSFAIYSQLCDRAPGPFASAIDALGHKKQIYFRASHAFSSVYAVARRTDNGVDITVVNYRRTELSARLRYSVLDAGNNLIYDSAEDIHLSPLSRKTFSVSLDEYISGREGSCYLEYAVAASEARYSDNLLFVRPKDFLFEVPDIKLKVEGAGNDFYITLSSDKYVSGVEIYFDGIDVEISDSGFDITSSAPIKLSAKLKSGKFSAEELSAMIRVNCLNTIGNDN